MTDQETHDSDVGLDVALAFTEHVRLGEGPTELRRVLGDFGAGRITNADLVALHGVAEATATIVAHLVDGQIDAAAALVNALLDEFPTTLHLQRDGDGWTVHHHAPDASTVSAWAAPIAASLARAIGEGRAERLGECTAEGCGRPFYDLSKNHSRRFCSLACQNRAKAAAYRARRAFRERPTPR